jgi:hypothetical protein
MNTPTLGQISALADKNPDAAFVIDGDRDEIVAFFPDHTGALVEAGAFTSITGART